MASTIECPKCRNQFDPGEAFSKNIKEELGRQFEKERAALLQNLAEQRGVLEKQQQDFEAKRQRENEIFAEKMKQAREQIVAETDKRVREDYETRLQSLEAEKQQKTQQLQEFERKQLDLLREKSELEEKQKNFELEVEKKFFEKREEMEAQIMSREKELFDLRMKEKETQMDSLRRTIEELKRKSEQGSSQLQGEAQELLLEEILQEQFPFDIVEEVPKGVEGADCIQVVRNTQGKECGRIIYESKRTKNWHNEWISKLKNDMRSCGADAAILVTQAFPKDMERFGERDGVWVCSYADVASVAAVLRGAVLRVADARKSEENKGEKMQMLYDFLTGNEFRQQVEAIVEGFMALKQAIAKERLQMEKLWKEREKQLEKVMLSTSGMYGSIKGIAGASVGDIPLLDGGQELIAEEMN
jgi:hypothetical protein